MTGPGGLGVQGSADKAETGVRSRDVPDHGRSLRSTTKLGGGLCKGDEGRALVCRWSVDGSGLLGA